MKNLSIYILFLSWSLFIGGCASRKTVKLTEKYPNKALKTYQKVTTFQVCKENCRLVKTKRKRIEYYETGKVKSFERTVNELSLDGNYHSQKNYSRFYDENGKLAKKVKKDDLEGTVYVYENGKLKSKKSFDQ